MPTEQTPKSQNKTSRNINRSKTEHQQQQRSFDGGNSKELAIKGIQ